MELSALRAFVEVAERTSFSEAAHALFLTQPAVSKRVAVLESELGAPLFDLDDDVIVRVNGEERFRGKVARTFSTLLMTLPRYDPDLLFDARVDL